MAARIMAKYNLLHNSPDVPCFLQPTHLAAAFDADAPLLRQREYAADKAQRQAMLEEVVRALPDVERLLSAWSLAGLSCTGLEADDILGTLVPRRGARVRVLHGGPGRGLAEAGNQARVCLQAVAGGRRRRGSAESMLFFCLTSCAGPFSPVVGRPPADPFSEGVGKDERIVVADFEGNGFDGLFGGGQEARGPAHTQVGYLVHGTAPELASAEPPQVFIAIARLAAQTGQGPFVRQVFCHPRCIPW
jgi:hypothetical protein